MLLDALPLGALPLGALFAAPPALLQAAEGPGAGPNMWILLLGPLAILWFLAIWPERKERKRKAAMLADLKKNDRVLTTSGIYATVAAVSDSDLTLKFDEGPTRVRVLKSAIASVLSPQAEEAAKTQG